MTSRTGTTRNLSNYLSKKHALLAFEINAEAMTEAATNMSDEKFLQEMGKIQDKAGYDLAESARKTMAKWLSPSDPRKIGLTGESSRNLYTKKVSAPGSGKSKTQIVWYVFEGDLTKANKYIRMGTRGNRSKSLRARANAARNSSEASRIAKDRGLRLQQSTYIESPFFARLSEWAKARGLKPRILPPRLHRKVYSGQGIGPGPATQVNLARDQYKSWKSMLWAIYHSMLQHGTSRAYEKRFGSKNYDYVKLYMTGKGGGNSGTARSVIRSKLGKSSEVYQNISFLVARYISAKFYKSGAVRGNWSARTFG
jgi:hypothetical protein